MDSTRARRRPPGVRAASRPSRPTIFPTLNPQPSLRPSPLPIKTSQADLLQALPPARRGAFADRWLEMESLLGRPTFHRIFDHVMAIDRAAGRELGPGPDAGGGAAPPPPAAWQARLGAASGGGGGGGAGEGDDDDGAAGGAGPDAGAFGGAGSAALLRHFGAACGSGSAAAAALERVLDFAHKLLMVRQNDWGQLRSEGGTGEARRAGSGGQLCSEGGMGKRAGWGGGGAPAARRGRHG
jgi:hypothetical protein